MDGADRLIFKLREVGAGLAAEQVRRVNVARLRLVVDCGQIQPWDELLLVINDHSFNIHIRFSETQIVSVVMLG